jgi:hypothetical protein
MFYYLATSYPGLFASADGWSAKKGPGFGWSVLQPDWPISFNVIIQYMWK